MKSKLDGTVWGPSSHCKLTIVVPKSRREAIIAVTCMQGDSRSMTEWVNEAIDEKLAREKEIRKEQKERPAYGHIGKLNG